MDFREITVYGRLGRDCEMKSYGDGKQLMSFAVGTTCGFGEKQKSIWYKCTSFRAMDFKIADYLVKGQPVIVCGEHGKDEWTDQNGIQKSADTINVSKIILLPKGEQQSQQPQAQWQAPVPQQQPIQQQWQQPPAQGGWGGAPVSQPGRQGPAAQMPPDDVIPFN